MNQIDIGFIDNIVYDFHRGRLTPKREIEQMIDNLGFKEANSIIKWWNRANRDGIGSVAHLKLLYNAISIIEKNLPKASFSDIMSLTDSKKYLKLPNFG